MAFNRLAFCWTLNGFSDACGMRGSSDSYKSKSDLLGIALGNIEKYKMLGLRFVDEVIVLLYIGEIV